MKNQSGVYEILNTANGKRYIGSTDKLDARFARHRSGLRRGGHHSPKLQAAWNKYGEASFKFLPILTCAKSMLHFYEQQLLDKVKPEYNIARIAGAPMAGRKHSKATRKKLSDSGTGKIKTDAHKLAISVANKNSAKGKVQRAQLHADQIGRPCSDATRGKIAEAHTGKPLSQAHREAISAGAQGAIRPPTSDIARVNMSRGQMGNTNKLGKPTSLETKALLSKLATERYAARRATK